MNFLPLSIWLIYTVLYQSGMLSATGKISTYCYLNHNNQQFTFKKKNPKEVNRSTLIWSWFSGLCDILPSQDYKMVATVLDTASFTDVHKNSQDGKTTIASCFLILSMHMVFPNIP